MIVFIQGIAGNRLSLDLREKLGERVELQSFHFIVPPMQFRLVRNNVPLQEWQTGNTEMYDLQHGPTGKEWGRGGNWFINDLHHRNDVATCGVLSRDVEIETRGLGFPISLHVWAREGTFAAKPATVESLRIIQP